MKDRINSGAHEKIPLSSYIFQFNANLTDYTSFLQPANEERDSLFQ